jgi:hypothetical protein
VTLVIANLHRHSLSQTYLLTVTTTVPMKLQLPKVPLSIHPFPRSSVRISGQHFSFEDHTGTKLYRSIKP